MRLAVVAVGIALSLPAWALPELESGSASLDPTDLDTLPALELRPLGESVPLTRGGPGFQGVVNGTPVASTEYENVVALGAIDDRGNGFVFCSGSLIDPEWVLTAAHCVDGMDYIENYGFTLVIIVDNDIFTAPAGEAVPWRAAFPHPQYDGTQFLNDIGLVELAEPLNGVDLVVLNDEAVTSAWWGESLTTLGFGITTDGANDAGTKRVTELEIFDNDGMYVYTFDPSTNVCQGDSGGPAFETTGAGNLEQVGVNAFVMDGCEGGAAGLTRVDVYVPWILTHAPNVLLSGSGEGSGGEDPGTGPGTDPSGDPEPADELDPDEIDQDLGDAPRPAKRSYPIGLRCDHAGGTPLAGWLLGLAVVTWRRRGARPQRA